MKPYVLKKNEYIQKLYSNTGKWPAKRGVYIKKKG